jgi:hypothetical protein
MTDNSLIAGLAPMIHVTIAPDRRAAIVPFALFRCSGSRAANFPNTPRTPAQQDHPSATPHFFCCRKVLAAKLCTNNPTFIEG